MMGQVLDLHVLRQRGKLNIITAVLQLVSQSEKWQGHNSTTGYSRQQSASDQVSMPLPLVWLPQLTCFSVYSHMPYRDRNNTERNCQVRNNRKKKGMLAGIQRSEKRKSLPQHKEAEFLETNRSWKWGNMTLMSLCAIQEWLLSYTINFNYQCFRARAYADKLAW